MVIGVLAALLLSFSRSAWLATALVLPPLLCWLALRRRDLRRSLALAMGGAMLLLLAGAILFAGQLSVRLNPSSTPTETRSINERGALIAVALQTIADHPLVGVGAGNFPLVVEAVNAPAFPQPVHNVLLLLAAELGILGGALWFWLWVAPAMALDERLRQTDPWPVVLAGAWLALGIIALWDDYPWGLEPGRLLGVSLLAATSKALAAPSLETGAGTTQG
ncbi:MAG: hypothetical protein KatS3mg057_2065 [Herpetosiphonaceae bacterium]|nr:MAG: hypothetical protein KatS3mg057_2065 [Herpetosiphonaceae bacterium]